jgi:AcrR family transcriptional regulator
MPTVAGAPPNTGAAPHEEQEEPGAPGRGAGNGRQGAHVLRMQRRRLVAATLELVGESGVQSVNIARLCQRAGVSRKTFYELFGSREDCLLAAFEQALGQAERELLDAAASERRWRGRVRAGLAGLLSYFDREPAIARVLVVEALGAGEPTLEARGGALERLVSVIDEGRAETRGREPPVLTAEGVVGAVLSVVHARLLARDRRPLLGLAGPLTAMAIRPYLGSTAAQKEIDTPVEIPSSASPVAPRVGDPFKGLGIRLTYRTARVLGSIGGSPGSSNKQVAAAAGISDQGQISRLLARLERIGLIENTGGEPASGEPKAWTLTTRGEQVLQTVQDT